MTMRVEAEPAYRTAAANPYNALLADALVEHGARVRDLSYLRLALGRADIVHLHWPDLTFLSGHRMSIVRARLFFFRNALRLARLRGTRLVWTVHNLESHESRATPVLRERLHRMLVAELDGLLALSASSLELARQRYPELDALPGFVTPHGHYRAAYDWSLDRGRARELLGVPAEGPLVVTVGQIRPYKNIPALLDAFSDVAVSGARLVVAGRPSSAELAEDLRAAADGDPRVVLDLAFQSDERMAWWLRAADLVVLPYRAVLNSGSAILALSADRPVLVPDLGSLTELGEQLGAAWVRTFHGELSSAELSDAIRWATEAGRPVTVDLDPLEWDTVAHQTLEAYSAVREHPRIPVSRRNVPPERQSATGSPIVPIADATLVASPHTSP
ncbi:glycosyltransferase family 4 protein [Protaetiibacter intestinalis]|nr:glycosyltransferase family 4 protein [Protaetiibacter intestinalis]